MHADRNGNRHNLSTLYIRLPSRSAAESTNDSAAGWASLRCAYAQTQGDTLMREGHAPLAQLADAIAGAAQVVLILSACDVSLLQAKIPPLSAARLRAALPNLLEDQLMSEPGELVFIPGATLDGQRMVAVIARDWLEMIAQTIFAYGARHLVALAAQLCLPLAPGALAAACYPSANGIDLSLRLGAQSGIGLFLQSEPAQTSEQTVLQTLAAITPTQPLYLTVPSADLATYQAAAKELALDLRITVAADHWSRWITGARAEPLNLLSSLDGAGTPGFDWKPWRWPLILLALGLLVNILGLNADWWRLQSEASSLRSQMLQTYKASFPRENVIVDPLAQMQQHMAAAQRSAGQPAADDFAILCANFSAAWTLAGGGQTASAVIAGVDYHDRSLFLRLKQGAILPREALRSALADYALTFTPAANNTWQIRSAK